MSSGAPAAVDQDQVIKISDPGKVGREHHTKLDRLVIRTGNIVSWAFPVLMVCIVVQVLMRWSGNNQAWLDDLQWWVYGFAMMTGFAYAITTSSHVRVDVLHQNFTPEKKAKIEVIAIGWMLIPFLALMGDILVHYAIASIESGEGSSSPNGLHRVYILKTALPFLFLLAGLAAWAVFRRNLKVFSPDVPSRWLIWAFPSAVFITWRIFHYIAYWAIFFTNSEITPRRISREPVFEYLLPAALALVIALIIIFWLRDKSRASEGAH